MKINSSLKQFSLKYIQQLNNVQITYNNLSSNLQQRLQCIIIQILNIKKIISGKSNHWVLNLIHQIDIQYNTIVNFCIELKKKQSLSLLQKQTSIHQSSQFYHIIKQYQHKISQMSYILYNKQVDITVDHIGKFNQQKPMLLRFRLFSKAKTQIQNIFYFFKKIFTYKQSINKLLLPPSKQQQKVVNVQHQSKIGNQNSSPTNKQKISSSQFKDKDEKQTTCTTKSQDSSSSQSSQSVRFGQHPKKKDVIIKK